MKLKYGLMMIIGLSGHAHTSLELHAALKWSALRHRVQSCNMYYVIQFGDWLFCNTDYIMLIT